MPTFGSKPFRSSRTPEALGDRIASSYRKRLAKHPFALFGLPFIALMLGASFLLTPATALRYEKHDRKNRELSHTEAMELGLKGGLSGEGTMKYNPRRRKILEGQDTERDEYYVRAQYDLTVGKAVLTCLNSDLWRKTWTTGSRSEYNGGKASPTVGCERCRKYNLLSSTQTQLQYASTAPQHMTDYGSRRYCFDSSLDAPRRLQLQAPQQQLLNAAGRRYRLPGITAASSLASNAHWERQDPKQRLSWTSATWKQSRDKVRLARSSSMKCSLADSMGSVAEWHIQVNGRSFPHDLSDTAAWSAGSDEVLMVHKGNERRASKMKALHVLHR